MSTSPADDNRQPSDESVVPNSAETPEVDGWVLANAAEVARNIERHGIPTTWSEAAERLRRTAELMSCPIVVPDDGGKLTSLPQEGAPLWQQVGFAESVACAAVHYAGQPYYPEDPQGSRVEIAIPWGTASALVHLLSALLVARLTVPTPSGDEDCVGAAHLLSRLSLDVAFELSRDDDDLLGEEEMVGERVYLLMRSCDVWQALDLLSSGREALRLAGTADMESLDLTLWDARSWLFGPHQEAS
jgi:hypothetical protein